MNYGGMKVAQLRALILERGIELHSSKLKKADYIALLEEDDEKHATVVEVEAEVIGSDTSEIIPKFTINYQVGTIDVDFSELEQRALAFKEEWKDWIPDTSNKDDMELVKSNRLYVSEQRKLFKESVKKVVDSYGAPLKKFKEQVKRIEEILEETYRLSKDVEDAVTEAQRQQTKDDLEESYIAFAGVLADTIPFDSVCEQKWLTKSFGFKKAENELEAKVKAIVNDWQTLSSLDLAYKTEAEGHFFKHLNLNEAIAFAQKLEEDNKKVEALREQVNAIKEPESTVTVERINRPISLEPVEQVELKPGDDTPIVDTSKIPSAWIMLVDSATPQQCQEIGKFCGSLGVTGKFIKGFVGEGYIRTYIDKNKWRTVYGG